MGAINAFKSLLGFGAKASTGVRNSHATSSLGAKAEALPDTHFARNKKRYMAGAGLTTVVGGLALYEHSKARLTPSAEPPFRWNPREFDNGSNDF